MRVPDYAGIQHIAPGQPDALVWLGVDNLHEVAVGSERFVPEYILTEDGVGYLAV